MAARLRAGTKWATRAGTGWLALLAVPALVASGQSKHTGSAQAIPAYKFQIAATPGQAAAQAFGEVVREIDDPSTGDRWLLVPDHAGGPGRLMLAGHRERSQNGAEKAETQSAPSPGRQVIHAGDALIVEEHTAVVDARLEAIALNPAAKGSPLNARLKIGGNVVRVVAQAPGRAVLTPASEDQR